MRDDALLALLTIASFVIGLQNLELNEQQVDSLDKHLADQDRHLFRQDKILSEEQNDMLRRLLKGQIAIIENLKEIKNALKAN